MTTAVRWAWRAWVLLVCLTGTAGAQVLGLPSEPIAFADGRVTVGGDIVASVGPKDKETGYFNQTDYHHSALRLLRIDVSAAVKAGPHFALLGEIRTENFGQVRPYAAYVRIRPWTSRNLDVQVGMVPPAFGAFARRTYANDNPLVGYPLGYQYMTTMRADALAANVDELLTKRSEGWGLRWSVGNPTFDGGLALVSAFRWDTGVQVHASSASGVVHGTIAVTAGTVSNPRFHDDNDGPQVVGRVELRPASGLVLGASLARGAFVADDAARAALGDPRAVLGAVSNPDDSRYSQSAWGGDVEYSRGHSLLRYEVIGSGWRLPRVEAPLLPKTLGALSNSLEGRYKLRPGLYVAARWDWLGFSDVVGTKETVPWDAPVKRLEAGVGYSLQRNLLLKLSYQLNRRDGGKLERAADFPAAQLVFWF
jgi:hypothetical protein